MAQAWLELSGRSVDVGGLRSFCSPRREPWSQKRVEPLRRAPRAAKALCMGGAPTQLLPSLPAIHQTAIESFGSNRVSPLLKHAQSPTTQIDCYLLDATLRTAFVRRCMVWQLDPC